MKRGEPWATPCRMLRPRFLAWSGQRRARTAGVDHIEPALAEFLDRPLELFQAPPAERMVGRRPGRAAARVVAQERSEPPFCLPCLSMYSRVW
jgi:hypothetical protein